MSITTHLEKDAGKVVIYYVHDKPTHGCIIDSNDNALIAMWIGFM